jgi:hypothetical protein
MSIKDEPRKMMVFPLGFWSLLPTTVSLGKPVELPPVLEVPPVDLVPPVLEVPPVDLVPLVLEVPPVDWLPPVVATPPVLVAPPRLRAPPVEGDCVVALPVEPPLPLSTDDVVPGEMPPVSFGFDVAPPAADVLMNELPPTCVGPLEAGSPLQANDRTVVTPVPTNRNAKSYLRRMRVIVSENAPQSSASPLLRLG